MRVFNAKFFFIFFTLCLFSIKGQAQEGNSYSNSYSVGPGNYTAACYGGQVGAGALYCPSAGAGVSYMSTSNYGFGYFIVGGTMSFAVSPKDLVGRPITAKGGGYFYVHIDFWDQITGEKVAWFNGGGIVAGGFTDFGSFH
ncbi:MAG: hypothetical protein DCC88_02105 [Spirobacillus cienkowskii]|jgi:hypothetical protein|uniref:Uncharacterized protein n=1 Tax=Spirobacillus cienkowskii TaxID=495820 RepID=A0A369KZ61_9BACT|nr:MAG: hypothetical protein DCC88_02105 [Spirobacillus cienkowskii]